MNIIAIILFVGVVIFAAIQIKGLIMDIKNRKVEKERKMSNTHIKENDK